MKSPLYPMVLTAVMAALLAVCSWICIPVGNAVFTLQSFGVALTLLLLGGKWGHLSICLYLLLGAAGLPVFSGFRGGIGILLGPTGGFLQGFFLWGLLYRFIVDPFNSKRKGFALLAGNLLCYAYGAFWLCFQQGQALPLIFVTCILPYLLPDAVKLWLSWTLAKRLKRFVY